MSSVDAIDHGNFFMLHVGWRRRRVLRRRDAGVCINAGATKAEPGFCLSGAHTLSKVGESGRPNFSVAVCDRKEHGSVGVLGAQVGRQLGRRFVPISAVAHIFSSNSTVAT
jgi:hypothetical protein